MISPVDIQRLLRAAGYYQGDLDGDLGPKSQKAISTLLEKHHIFLPAHWRSFPLKRRSVMAAQIILKFAGFEDVGVIDGYAGMLTQQAMVEWNMTQVTGKHPEAWRPDDVPAQVPLLLPDTPVTPAWGTQKDMEKRFGVAGGPQCTRGEVKLPYEMLIAWNLDDTITKIRCHELVATSIERVLARVASAYSPDAIKDLGLNLFGGCFNYRKKRGGGTLSTHAWGVALDFDPERNQLKWGKTRARLAKDDAVPWWRCWEAEGWLSLGRARNFDWMHVQAPGL